MTTTVVCSIDLFDCSAQRLSARYQNSSAGKGGGTRNEGEALKRLQLVPLGYSCIDPAGQRGRHQPRGHWPLPTLFYRPFISFLAIPWGKEKFRSTRVTLVSSLSWLLQSFNDSLSTDFLSFSYVAVFTDLQFLTKFTIFTRITIFDSFSIFNNVTHDGGTQVPNLDEMVGMFLAIGRL